MAVDIGTGRAAGASAEEPVLGGPRNEVGSGGAEVTRGRTASDAGGDKEHAITVT